MVCIVWTASSLAISWECSDFLGVHGERETLLERAAFLATVHGLVQGVFFRDFVQQHARALGLTGYVKNLSGGRSLEVCVEGEKEKLEELLSHLKVGPRRARVERVDVEWSEYTGRFKHFILDF